jgi:Ni,Fe-hydrogenase III large subunit
MIPKFVERKNFAQTGGSIQLSTLFEIDGEKIAVLSDTENDKTILTDASLELREKEAALFGVQDATAGSPVDIDLGTKIQGYGVFTFPYGPVTSGIAEAGGFKFLTYGERILKVVPLVNFKKRGIESKVTGMDPNDALLLIERSAGNFSASYSSCFANVAEDAMGIEVPQSVKWTRAVAIELERIYNHLHVFSREAEAASQNIAAFQVSALKERILRLNAKYFGHRYLFGLNQIGGVIADLSDIESRKNLFASMRSITSEFSQIVEYFLSSRIFLDRLQNTAQLKKDDALALGAVGPVARGSGIDWDDRVAHPIAPYDDVFVDISTENGCDAMARVMVRIKEITASTTVIQQLLDKMPNDRTRQKTNATSLSSSASHAKDTNSGFSLCRIESPSGDLIQAVKLGKENRIEKLHIRPASLANWLSFAKSLEGNVFTDFQFSFDSFGLNYADSDR